MSETKEQIKKSLLEAQTSKARLYPRWPASSTGGVMAISLKNRFREERARLGPEFTPAERDWRMKWHLDQTLHPQEPYTVKEMEKDLKNPIRRLLKMPWDYIERRLLIPQFGQDVGKGIRYISTRVLLTYFLICCSWYTLKYNHYTWEKPRGWRINASKQDIYPGHPDYPRPYRRTEKWEHSDYGFSKRQIFKDLENYAPKNI